MKDKDNKITEIEISPPNSTPKPSLSVSEKVDIEQKIEYEIVQSHHNMLKLGAIANIIGGAFYALLLLHQDGPEKQMHIGLWYLTLVLTNTINISWALRYKSNTTMSELENWRNGFLFIIAAICLTWSSIGIIFLYGQVHYQLLTLVFLLAVLICFSFSSITDFTVASISITCLLIPTLSYRSYLGFSGQDPNINLGISACFLVLGMFMLVTCYIGHNLVRKFFRLSFENVLLSNKLEIANEFLEQRVKERTVELENSLKIVKFQATHDLLTGLPNQRLLLDYLHTAIDESRKHKQMFAIACVIINEIEKIIEALGPQAGEVILRRLAQRFQNIFANENSKKLSPYSFTISRQDVFIILINPIKDLTEIESKIDFLFSLLNDAVIVKEQPIHLTASIGVSVYPTDGLDIKSLIMHAGTSASHAKKVGGNNVCIYQAGIDTDISRQLSIDSQLHSALRKNEFKLVYQPFIDLKTEKIRGVEALLRWTNPILGIIPPLEFIPIAEANGTILAIGEWVLRTACTQLGFWHAQGYTSLQVSVNLSAKQLQQKNLVQVMTDSIAHANLKPKDLKLELTESKVFNTEVVSIINSITDLGISLAIDDFGTGYSALSSLKLFEIDQVKIDKSFIDDVTTDKDSQAIVLNTIALAKKLNINVIAEGAEKKEQVDFLREHGCDMVQGFYFSKPLDPDKFTELLQMKFHKKTVFA